MGKLILKVRGEKLPNMDIFSKSDPYLCVYIVKGTLQIFHLDVYPQSIYIRDLTNYRVRLTEYEYIWSVSSRTAKTIILLTERK